MIVITEIELLSFHALAQADEQVARDFLGEVTRHPLTDSIWDQAIALRRQFRLKFPDTLIAATSMDIGDITEQWSRPSGCAFSVVQAVGLAE